MTPTTLRAVAADCVATIRNIVPTYPEHQVPWRSVEKVEQVQGTRIRLFHCRWGFPRPVTDGLFGDGVEWEVDLDIFTNYRGLPEEMAQDQGAEIVGSDGNQLWITLEERVDPIVPGLISYEYTGFAPEEDEPHELYGAHQFLVRYLVTHRST